MLKQPLAIAVIAVTGLVSAVLLATTASATSSCGVWSTSKDRREEGRQWTASICAPGKGRDALLEIVCSGDNLNIRYLPVLPDDADPKDGMQDFVFSTSTGSRRVALGYEGLDGAFATNLDRRHPLFEMIMSGDELTIRDGNRKVATQLYTLKGSRKAVSKLMRMCR